MNKEILKEKLEAIIDRIAFAGQEEMNEQLKINDKLHIILSESSQALALVTTIEDEFDIALDDDDVNLDFFVDIEVMTERVFKAVS